MSKNQRFSRFLYCFSSILILISMACNVPSAPTAVPTPTLKPTEKPIVNLPPTLVEVTPLPSSDIAPNAPLTFTFSEPMDRPSVEAAIQGNPPLAGSFEWISDTTVRFVPSADLPLSTDLMVSVSTSAKAANGLALVKPFEIPYHTSGGLIPVTMLPAPNTYSIDPSSVLTVAFNRPVVPLAAEATDLPVGFTVNPSVEGRGEWLNTSTYVFYPEPPLLGGADYTITLNPDLTTTDGVGYAEEAADSMSWSFRTNSPMLSAIEPDGSNDIMLDQEFKLTFNQGMDPASFQQNTSLKDVNGIEIPCTVTWDETKSIFTVKPDGLLARNTFFSLTVSGETKSLGGAALGNDFESNYYTVPVLGLKSSNPEEGGEMLSDYYWMSVNLTFTAPLAAQDLTPLISIEPALENMQLWSWKDSDYISINGDFQPRTDYTVRIAQGLQDKWGGTLSEPLIFHFSTSKPLPFIYFPYYNYGSMGIFVTPDAAVITARATNVTYVNMSSGALNLQDYIFVSEMWENNTYTPTGGLTTWRQYLEIPADKNVDTNINLSPSGGSLPTGLYYIRVDAPEITREWETKQWVFLTVVSNTQLTTKRSGNDFLVWAVNLATNQPIAGKTVYIYDTLGNVLDSALTDADGIARLQPSGGFESNYDRLYVALSEPGDPDFSVASTSWSQGVSPYQLGVNVTDETPDQPIFYLYTDRPIYRPGQTVYFRAIARNKVNGRYTLPDLSNINLEIHGVYSQATNEEPLLYSASLPLSPYGSTTGSFVLPENAPPGSYTINIVEGGYSIFSFQVEEYRKPEIEVAVAFSQPDAKMGTDLQATVNAQYYFGSPAGDINIAWKLYYDPGYFYLPGYQTGTLDTSWFNPSDYYFGYSDSAFGNLVLSGEAHTGLDGKLMITIPWSDLEGQISLASLTNLTMEATISEADELPVSGRGTLALHPAEFYVGVNPEQWGGQANEEQFFSIFSAGWDKNPSPSQSLTARFEKMRWVPTGFDPNNGIQTYEIVYDPIAATDFRTGADGKARLAFTPPSAGTYRLEVSGGGAITQVMIWVGGAGASPWPDMPKNRLRLTTDADKYKPGDTATIFIPNPFVGETIALITTERGIVTRADVVTISGTSYEYKLQLTEDDAPNIYFSIVLIGHSESGIPGFRYGLVNLPVDRSALTLKVTMTPAPLQGSPGGEVTYTLHITDQQGNPIQGEFSLSLADKAVLALTDPNSEAITDFFYGTQGLGVYTSLSLSAAGYRTKVEGMVAGRGGGGGGDMSVEPSAMAGNELRENYKDTAFWNGAIETDANGDATVTFTLPDNLTTWVAEVRGTTTTSLVGQATGELVVSKPLLVRPQTPRFLVAGDRVQLAANVHNNTNQDLTVDVSLQASGVELEDSSSANQQISLRTGERYRVTWWVTVTDAAEADLIFSAVSGVLQDSARPEWGKLPILRYSSPLTYGTAGMLAEPGEQLEIVALPQSFTPTGGKLSVELSPSLAAAILDGLKAQDELPKEDYTVAVISRLLPNIETYKTLQDLGIDSPELKARLEANITSEVELLVNAQNSDGGWGWMSGSESDEYISTYVLFGLVRVSKADIAVNALVLENGSIYLFSQLDFPTLTTSTAELNRLAFQYYTLVEAGNDAAGTAQLYTYRDRLAPWAKAFLALALDNLNPGDEHARVLISDLESSAVRSATGAHWEVKSDDYYNLVTGNYTTAVVVLALAKFDPASPLLTDAVRYLAAHRNANGCWDTTFESAWVLMSLTEVLKASGDLQADYGFSATVNDQPIASGEARGLDTLTTVTAEVPLSSLYAAQANALRIKHDQGSGRLYYRAFLQIFRPVESAEAVNKGMTISRSYYLAGQDCTAQVCEPIQSLQLGNRQQLITTRITLTLPNDAYYLVVDDFIPAGSEVLNSSLKTSQLGEGKTDAGPLYSPGDPFRYGWGWWWFSSPQIYDDHIRWVVSYLPAGTYELTYTLVPTQLGEFRVIPAHAYEYFFPEVEGASAGTIFTISE